MAGPIKVTVCGALGRMGQRIIQAVLSRPEQLVLSGVVERPGHPQIGQNIGPLAGAAQIDLKLAEALAPGSDVYIDFTSVEASLAYLEQATALGLAGVIGSTGFSPEQKERLAEAGRKIPLLWAPNMSIGINALYKIVSALTKALGPDFDIEIVEAHHRLKKDAPSGTALKLQETIAQARGLDPAASRVSGRDGQVGERTRDEIGVLALRGGDIVGDHTIYFCGQGERLEITHRAHSRDTFAEGAARAAIWLAGRTPGLYSFEDIMNLN